MERRRKIKREKREEERITMSDVGERRQWRVECGRVRVGVGRLGRLCGRYARAWALFHWLVFTFCGALLLTFNCVSFFFFFVFSFALL